MTVAVVTGSLFGVFGLILISPELSDRLIRRQRLT